MRPILLALIALLAGCETSPVWYANHPQRQIVQIDGFDINVVPRGPNQYDVLGGFEGIKTNMAALKARHIRAVELVTRCKVIGAEFIAGTDISQTVVNCS